MKELFLYKNYILECKKLKRIFVKEENINGDPFFSIILPVYNAENYIGSSFFSINQYFKNFEIIIINDYSNNETLNII